MFLLIATAAAADTASFEDRVLRYRADPDSDAHLIVAVARPDQRPVSNSLSVTSFRQPIGPGPGCSLDSDWVLSTGGRVFCPLSEAGDRALEQVRSRFTLTRHNDQITFEAKRLKGVVFAGAGVDSVTDGDRVYTGPGDDYVEGYHHAFGGPGNDELGGPEQRLSNLARGGPGDDHIVTLGGRSYGGPGDDRLEEYSFSPDMLVGGRGRDTVVIGGGARVRHVVRLRGGGADRIECEGALDRTDVVLVDRTDRVGRECRTGQVLLTGRPRQLWP
jgi:hypothetical protein